MKTLITEADWVTAEENELYDLARMEGCPLYVVAFLNGRELPRFEEYQAIRFLLDSDLVAGDNEAEQLAQIKEDTGRTKTQMENVMVFDELEPAFIAGLQAGVIPVGMAPELAKQTPRVTKKLLDLLKTNGCLKGKDINEAKQVQRQSEINALPEFLFEAAPVQTAPAYPPAYYRAWDQYPELVKQYGYDLNKLLAAVNLAMMEVA